MDLQAEVEQLREALLSRTVTAQATGLLAGRFQLPTDRAWRLLREASNMSNRRLVDIAAIVVASHDGIPITREADQEVALALAGVLDTALARVRFTTGAGQPRRSRAPTGSPRTARTP